MSKYEKVKGFSQQEAKLNYLVCSVLSASHPLTRCDREQDYVQEWPFYGSTFWSVEQRQFKDYPGVLTLGINGEGVCLMHPEKRVRPALQFVIVC